ncbi:transposase [Streptomyces sp. NBRC 110611]|nr:transposase [Streptomyces sp. NBRC 110611]
MDGVLLAVFAPVPDSWHYVRAWRESGFRAMSANRGTIGDPGYIGTGILTGRRKPPDRQRPEADKIFNHSLSVPRAAVERAIAHPKDWKVPATRYRGPLRTFPNIIRTVTALAFFRAS